jgi:glucose-1-phosphate cytidylyltransferase
MKAVILAGGLGTRLSEETQVKPKPMVEIGGKPILWHIMKRYSAFGINEFVVCCGYKGYLIKEYFADYFLHMSDVTIDIARNETLVHLQKAEPWRISLIDTGETTMTGGRLKRIREYVSDQHEFCMTYGDGLSDVDIGELIAFHRRQGKKATLTAVQPTGRYGALSMDGSSVTGFVEKPKGDGGWVNGGFFVLSLACLDYISGDDTTWENEPLKRIAAEGELAAYQHSGFWQPMDTLRDKIVLEALWASGKAPWMSPV